MSNTRKATEWWHVVMYTKENRKIYLSHNDRMKWRKRTAEKHLKDFSSNPMFTEHYVRFELEAE